MLRKLKLISIYKYLAQRWRRGVAVLPSHAFLTTYETQLQQYSNNYCTSNKYLNTKVSLLAVYPQINQLELNLIIPCTITSFKLSCLPTQLNDILFYFSSRDLDYFSNTISWRGWERERLLPFKLLISAK
jgi:hypothetical protein